MNYQPPTKPFAWSYTALKNYDTCPKKHYEIDIAKNYKDESGNAFGLDAHRWLAQRISQGVPLPPAAAQYEPWVAAVEEMAVLYGVRPVVELKLAFTRDFAPCDYFDKRKEVWFRGVIDVLLIKGDMAVVVDWKTGKILEDAQQLALFAQCVFIHYPEVNWCTTRYVWLKDNCATTEHFTRNNESPAILDAKPIYPQSMLSMWNKIWPRVQELEEARRTMNYPPQPSGLCKRHCPVVSCPYHGRGNA